MDGALFIRILRVAKILPFAAGGFGLGFKLDG
jgi:hypothetical protein